MERFGLLIAEKRKEKGLTQAALAAMLGVSGMAVSKWERGLAAPGEAHREHLVNLLGLEVEADEPRQTAGLDTLGEPKQTFLSVVRGEFWRIASAGVMLGICICRLLGTIDMDAAFICCGFAGAVFCLFTMLNAAKRDQ